MTSAKSQGGLIIIEALVGILIFSIGILAMVGMMSNAVNYVSEAKYRNDASFLSGSLVSDMWGNRPNLASYAYPGSGTVPAAIATWLNDLQTALPGVASNPPVISVSGSLVTVTVRWQDPSTKVVHSFTQTASLDCC